MPATRKKIPTRKQSAKKSLNVAGSGVLTGWQAIASFLGQPVTAAQRWAKDGMPVQRNGRAMTANPSELRKWLGRESGGKEAVLIPTGGEEDLLGHLRRGLKQARENKR